MPTKILLAAFMLLGMNAYADLTATDEGAAKFQESSKPAVETTEQVLKQDKDLKPEIADNEVEGRVCTTECQTPTTQSKSQLLHNNYKDLAEIGRISAKQP